MTPNFEHTKLTILTQLGMAKISRGKRNFRCYLTILLICSGLTSCSQSPQLLPIENDATILALGDSLTVGVGTQPEFSYPSILQAQVSQQIINAGISGDKTIDGLSRVEMLLKQHQPTLVIVCLGGNDFLRKVPKHTIKKNLHAIIQAIKSHQAQVLLVAVPDIGLFLDDSDIYQEVATQAKVPLLESVLSDLLSDKNFKSDTIHLNKQGYQMFALEIHQFLQKYGALTH